jgi:hypothetical protein
MNASKDATAISVKRREFDAMTARLAELRAQYDVLMNAFKFDAARALHARIETMEREHRALAAELPQFSVVPPPTPYRVGRRRRR